MRRAIPPLSDWHAQGEPPPCELISARVFVFAFTHNLGVYVYVLLMAVILGMAIITEI